MRRWCLVVDELWDRVLSEAGDVSVMWFMILLAQCNGFVASASSARSVSGVSSRVRLAASICAYEFPAQFQDRINELDGKYSVD